jgi:cell division septation protein DedD
MSQRDEPAALASSLPPTFESVLAATEGTRPEGARRRPFPRGRGAWGLVAVAAVTAAVGWTLLGPGDIARTPEDVPLILAEDSPTKQRPAEPGGITIPDQDKLVYGLIDPTSQDGEVVERLLPPPEEPVAIEPVAPAPEAATIGEALDESADLAGVAPAAGTEPVAVPDAEPAGTLAAAVPDEAEPATNRTWRVQIGAVKDKAQVDPEWRRLKGKLGDLVAGLALTVETADLGSGQGLYHRLQIGAFAERTGAEALCTELKSLKVDCLVVRR